MNEGTDSMIDTIVTMQPDQGDTNIDRTIEAPSVHLELLANIECLLANARPRLLRFAQAQGIAIDSVDDVVQETCIEAWRHLSQLQAPERFDAWLSGICRNVCLRWKRRQSGLVQHNATQPLYESALDASWEESLVDQAVLDPIEELSHQDLAQLLDRALGYLPENLREAVEMHYLAGLPQQEAAVRLGLTIKALEVRLVRARRQLRQVLSGELHTEAEEFGLAIDHEAINGWRETRLWCMFCGRHHLQGLLEPQPDGRVNLRMRCPDCEQYGSPEWIRTGGLYELAGLQSFRPALKRSQQVATNYWTSPENRQRCQNCQAPVQTRLIESRNSLPWQLPWQGLRYAQECSACGAKYSTYIGFTAWLHPTVQHFIEQHPRWINEPETLVEYAGQPAFRVRLLDIASSARLTLLLHTDTLDILASFQE
jgi:RNA polymerase sigma factor (sigma-70 family)